MENDSTGSMRDSATNFESGISEKVPPERRLPPKASRQRFKPQLSCTFCRTRKLKCDRNSPCTNCIKRDLSSSCMYIHSPAREKVAQTQKTSDGSKNVQERIQQLEELVMTLMNQTRTHEADSEFHGAVSSRTPFSTVSETLASSGNDHDDLQYAETPDSIGRISVDDEQQCYFGGGHWAAILENIAGLKESLNSDEWPQGTSITENRYKGPELLVGDNQKTSRESILGGLPTKPVVDMLLNHFFESFDGSALLVHGPTFRREYEEFWNNPDSKSISWIGLLFSILCFAANFEGFAGNGPTASDMLTIVRDPSQRAKLFRIQTAQCLVLSNYTEPSPYTVETLCLYYLSEQFENRNALFGSWMVFGIIVRAAMRLGYHRDASHFPSISVFRGEMQRRIWFAIVHLDNLSSCQVGLPRMIHDGMSDTKLPRLLIDEDLYENMEVLPPARPDNKPSTMGHALAKNRITSIFEKIVDATNSVVPIAYDEVLKFETMLSNAYQDIPECYKVREMNDISDSSIMMRQISVELFYLKTRCFLHRKFFVRPQSLEKYPYSVKACVDASMGILKFQKYAHDKSKEGYSWSKTKWISSSMMTHDFLLAATLLCLYLGQTIGVEDTIEARTMALSIACTMEDISQTLLGSYQIWTDPEHSSLETTRFAKVVKATLQKVGKWPITHKSPRETAENLIYDRNIGQFSTNGTMTPSSFNPSPNATPAGNFDMMGDLVNDTANFDWNLWDIHFQGNVNIDTESGLWTSNDHIPFQANVTQNDMRWSGMDNS